MIRSEGNTPDLPRATITPDNKIPLNPFKLELNLDPGNFRFT